MLNELSSQNKKIFSCNRSSAQRSVTSLAHENFRQADIELLKQQIFLHPTPLLMIADHYNRSAADASGQRIIGVLLGTVSPGSIHITNCFAVPFEECPGEKNLWFIETTYISKMFAMFRKINIQEQIVGWYSTGGQLSDIDIEINEFFRDFCLNPILLTIDFSQPEIRLNVQYVFEMLKNNKKKTFVQTSYVLDSLEAEEVAVDHLLRNVKHKYVRYSVPAKIQEYRTIIKTIKKSLPCLIEALQERLDNQKLDNSTFILLFTRLQEMVNSFLFIGDHDKLEQCIRREQNVSLVLEHVGQATQLVIALQDLLNNRQKIDKKN